MMFEKVVSATQAELQILTTRCPWRDKVKPILKLNLTLKFIACDCKISADAMLMSFGDFTKQVTIKVEQQKAAHPHM